LQDWVFFDRGSLELTLELHEQMQPPPQQLPTMWHLNKPALLRFAEMVSSIYALYKADQTWADTVKWAVHHVIYMQRLIAHVRKQQTLLRFAKMVSSVWQTAV
jgi:hypothetical protein